MTPVDETTSLCPLKESLVYTQEYHRYTIIDKEIARVEDRRGLEKVGENRWTGEHKPCIRFTKLCS